METTDVLLALLRGADAAVLMGAASLGAAAAAPAAGVALLPAAGSYDGSTPCRESV